MLNKTIDSIAMMLPIILFLSNFSLNNILPNNTLNNTKQILYNGINIDIGKSLITLKKKKVEYQFNIPNSIPAKHVFKY